MKMLALWGLRETPKRAGPDFAQKSMCSTIPELKCADFKVQSVATWSGMLCAYI